MTRVLRHALASILSTMILAGALLIAPGSTTPTETLSTTLTGVPAAGSPTVSDQPVLRLDAVIPSVATSRSAVTVGVVVAAPAGAPLAAGTLRVVRGTVDLDARTDLDPWADDTTPAGGATLGTVTLPALAAGTSRAVQVMVPPGAIRSSRSFQAIPISLELHTPGTGSSPVAVTHTFLAWLGARKEYEALDLAMIVPVTLDPDPDLFSRTAATKERAWERAIGPSSRIRTIIEGTRDTSATLMVDPTVLGPDPAAPTDGPSGVPSDGPSGGPTGRPTDPPTGRASDAPPATAAPSGPASITPSLTPSQTPSVAVVPALPGRAGQLADELAADLRGRSVWALPYADADLAATVDTDPANPLVRDLVDRATALATRLRTPVRADIAWPVDGALPTGREAALGRLFAGTRTGPLAGIVVDQDAITAASPYTPTSHRIGTGGTPLLGADTRLSQLLPTRTESVAAAAQRFLAETLVLLGERPGTARTALVAAPRTWDPDRATLGAFFSAIDVPWLHPVDATRLLGDAAPGSALVQQPPDTSVGSNPTVVPPPVLTPARLDQLDQQRDTIHEVSSVLRDPAAFERTYRELLDELVSVRWRYRPTAWTQLATAVTDEVRSATSAIKVIPRGVNFLAESGSLQVTIQNGLDYEIGDIRLVLSPTNPRMQVVEQAGPITIGAGSLTTVRVPMVAVAAGKADIRATLTTAEGTPIGQGAIIPVSANPLDAQIYWIGGITFGLILIAGILRTILRGTSRIDEIEHLPDDLKQDSPGGLR